MGREYFSVPSNCPACGSLLSEEGQFLYCRSKSCSLNLTGSLRVWVNKLGLLQWGDSLIESLTNPNKHHIESLSDIYDLSVDDIAMHCSGAKVAKKCYDILHANKTISLDLFLSALNIPNFGMSTAADMVEYGFDTIEKILNISSADEIMKVPNVGKKTADLIFSGLEEKRELIISLSKKVTIKVSGGPLVGKSFCITGSTKIPRKALEKKITDFGGSVKSSVTNGLSFLITNDQESGSSKMKNAQKYGTQIISEEKFLEMLSV